MTDEQIETIETKSNAASVTQPIADSGRVLLDGSSSHWAEITGIDEKEVRDIMRRLAKHGLIEYVGDRIAVQARPKTIPITLD